LEKAARRHQILVITEIHGDEAHFETHFPQIANDFHIFSTIGSSWATGGVTILVKKNYREGTRVFHEELVESRVLRVSILDSGYTTVVYGMHNHGLSNGAMNKVASRIGIAIEAYGDPAVGSVWPAGDWNYISGG
jgi:hypothetical protein